jgi:hypothetical protein
MVGCCRWRPVVEQQEEEMEADELAEEGAQPLETAAASAEASRELKWLALALWLTGG